MENQELGPSYSCVFGFFQCFPKPYRAAYREETAHLIAERGDLEWLSPVRIYEHQA